MSQDFISPVDKELKYNFFSSTFYTVYKIVLTLFMIMP